MVFFTRFLISFAAIWIQAALTLTLVWGAWHFLGNRNFEFVKDDAFLFSLLFMPTVAAIVIGLARAAGWKG